MRLVEKIENYIQMTSDKMQIPSYIDENLSKPLRSYQKNALINFLINNKTIKQKHLLFNMATGSGKTLMMAALMLECYKMGYRNFIFFVNSKTILEKTRANFCDSSSPKYLFGSSVNIEGEIVEINAIERLNDSKDGAINIYFTTIQSLFSLFNNERENSLNLNDLKSQKIVFLADEAHHLNADTKSNKSEKELKLGWESAIMNAFGANGDNMMLEFSATLPNNKDIHQKYDDKIIYEYDLKRFCSDGFAKRIFLIKYSSDDVCSRMLGACALSSYREMIARDNGVVLKPVVLFKSGVIKDSSANQEIFNEMIDNLTGEQIGRLYEGVGLGNELFSSSRSYFVDKFGGNWDVLAKHIRGSFKPQYQLNANDESEATANQIKLNTLEDKDNDIRAIFAVDKLNEGWDVLNLFDIVRLDKKSSAASTTKDAQLIGRGARYYPFGDDESKYVRKYDNAQSALSALERLSYHSLNDESYISALEKTMVEQGLLLANKKEIITLKPTKRAKQITAQNDIFYLKNERTASKLKGLELYNKVAQKMANLAIPLFSNTITEAEIYQESLTGESVRHRYMSVKHLISFEIFKKAMNILNITMNDIKMLDEKCGSKAEFYERICGIEFEFDRRQKFGAQNGLEIAKYILINYKEFAKTNAEYIHVSEFRLQRLENMGERVIIHMSNGKELKNDALEYEWLYYHGARCDSGAELEFLRYIDSHKEQLDGIFSEWVVVRNDGFSEFKIYDNRPGETYGWGFEPDFILFGKSYGSDAKLLGSEWIVEVKGAHLEQKDEWKEGLLEMVDGKEFELDLSNLATSKGGSVSYSKADGGIRITGFPFFIIKDKSLGDWGLEFSGKYSKKFDDKFNGLFNKGLFD